MIELIDTHAHLFLPAFSEDIDAVVQRARTAGVRQILLPNIDATTSAAMWALRGRYPDVFGAMVGLHPGSVADDAEAQLGTLEAELAERRSEVVAVGEIGLDFYWSRRHEAAQYRALERQFEWAVQEGLPVVLHTRNSFAETLDVVRRYVPRGLRGVFHCFTGNYEEARQALDAGFYLGIGGVVTFKNSRLIDTLRKTGLERVVLETDAPYLSPHPYRGRRNESARVRIIAEFLAEQLRMPLETVAERTTRHARELFGI